MKYTPIFRRDGENIIVRTEDFLGNTRQEAREIGLGASLVECIILGMKFENPDDILEIPEKQEDCDIKGYNATLGNVPVFILEEYNG